MNVASEFALWRASRLTAAGHVIGVFEAGSTAPDARTIVLVHGLGHWTQAAWNNVVPLLDPAQRVVAFDLPGFGSSDKPDVRYDGAFFVGVVESVLDQIVPGTFTLVGHSLGGFIAASYAAAHPDRVERLALIAPAGFLRAARFIYALLGSQLARFIFMQRPSRAFVRRTLAQSVYDPASVDEAVYARAADLAQEHDVRRAFAGVYMGAMQDFANAKPLHARLATYANPVLIIWGRHDRYIPIKALDATRAVYPHASVVICEGSGHLPMVEEPAKVAQSLTTFINANA